MWLCYLILIKEKILNDCVDYDRHWLSTSSSSSSSSSSPEALFPRGRSQRLSTGQLAKDGSGCLHREDEVEVCNRHNDAGQKGQAEAKGPHAAAKCCRRPVDQPAGDTPHIGGTRYIWPRGNFTSLFFFFFFFTFHTFFTPFFSSCCTKTLKPYNFNPALLVLFDWE